MDSEYFSWLAITAVVAFFAWRFFSHGGTLTGTLLGARVRKEVGEVRLSEGSLTSQVLRVVEMEDSDGKRFIGLAVVSKAPLAAGMVAYRLTPLQAQQLVSLLQRATGAQGGS